MAGLHDIAPIVANSVRDQRCFGPHTGRSGRSFTAGMAAANHRDVESIGH